MRAAAILLLLAACGADDAPGATDAAVHGDAPSCITTISCTGDQDCAVDPGTHCNTALAAPKCEPLGCGTTGQPCTGPELCAGGLVCFDAQHFGESATIYKAGVCSTPADTRSACTARCMQAWTDSQGMVIDECTQAQATALCQDVCTHYPAWDTCGTYFEMVDANDWKFRYMSCEPSLCPTIGLRCGTTETALDQSTGC